MRKHFDSKYGVTGYMGPVNYVSCKIQIVNRNTITKPSAKAFYKNDFFTKNQRFFEDREFQFVLLEFANIDGTGFNSFQTHGEIIENLEITKWISKK